MHSVLYESARETNLVIREVFPTDWSPNKTIFVRFNGDDEKSAVVGVPAFDIVD